MRNPCLGIPFWPQPTYSKILSCLEKEAFKGLWERQVLSSAWEVRYWWEQPRDSRRKRETLEFSKWKPLDSSGRWVRRHRKPLLVKGWMEDGRPCLSQSFNQSMKQWWEREREERGEFHSTRQAAGTEPSREWFGYLEKDSMLKRSIYSILFSFHLHGNKCEKSGDWLQPAVKRVVRNTQAPPLQGEMTLALMNHNLTWVFNSQCFNINHFSEDFRSVEWKVKKMLNINKVVQVIRTQISLAQDSVTMTHSAHLWIRFSEKSSDSEMGRREPFLLRRLGGGTGVVRECFVSLFLGGGQCPNLKECLYCSHSRTHYIWSISDNRWGDRNPILYSPR